MAPDTAQVQRLCEKLRLTAPVLAVFDAPPDPGFAPLIEVGAEACCFAYAKRWLAGETLVLRKGAGCMGAQSAFGLRAGYPAYMAHFLTDGVGAPMGEGLRASPELIQPFLDAARPPRLANETALIGPLRPDRWPQVRSVFFLVDPDRLAALMTLSAYWSSDNRLVSAPFSSGCGLLLREIENQEDDRPVIGATDLAMRRYLPPETMAFAVTPTRFEQMLGFPDDCFLGKDWWNGLMDYRERRRRTGSHERY